MGMTMTQKILARHAGLDHVVPGQLVEGKLDLVLGNDITTPVAISEFNKAGLTRVFDREKIALVLDHYTPCKDIKAAQLCAQVREFAQKYEITHFYDVGCMGVEHALLPEKGLTAPGECMIGADSHTCTYGAVGMFSTGVGSTDMAAGMATGLAWFRIPAAVKVTLKGKLQPCVSGKDVILHLIGTIGVDGALYKSLEFAGEGVGSLSMDDRFTIANMAIEAGAKNGIFPVDGRTRAYLEGRVTRPWQAVEADPDAEYEREVVIDLDQLTKVSRQLMVSMGASMGLVNGFAVMIFFVVVYLLSKMIIEKNAQSISMTKILGYNGSEIARLYLLSTTVVVVLCLVISLPIEVHVMKFLFRAVMMESMTGWIEMWVSPTLYPRMLAAGLATYAVVAVLEYRRIIRVPMDEALKNVE